MVATVQHTEYSEPTEKSRTITQAALHAYPDSFWNVLRGGGRWSDQTSKFSTRGLRSSMCFHEKEGVSRTALMRVSVKLLLYIWTDV